MYCVWAQPVDNDTSPKNLDEYGSVHNIDEELAEDDKGTPNKQHCDGQTSITPPRYANDRMVGIYTRSEEAANMIGDSLRQDIVRRAQMGQLTLPMGNWEPRYITTPLELGVNLRRLRKRVQIELADFPEDLIDSLLGEVLRDGLDISSVRAIIGQVRNKAQGRL